MSLTTLPRYRFPRGQFAGGLHVRRPASVMFTKAPPMTALRFAVRRTYRHPGNAIVAVSSLALAIAANITVFQLVDAVLWKQLPLPVADRLVQLVRPADRMWT